MFSYVSLEARIPGNHPLRKLRLLVDTLLATMDRELEWVYARTGRPSVPPERLLKAMLLQILFTIRSERLLLAESIDYNLLYRWFVGPARVFFERVKALADWKRLTRSEHFSVDGTLIDAWASHKSFRPKGDDGSGCPAVQAIRRHGLPVVPDEPPSDGEPQWAGGRYCHD